MLHRSRSVVAACAAVGALACASPASAYIIEVGDAPKEVTPTCPATPCVAVSRTTGYQSTIADRRRVYRVPRNGRIVAWTISLGNPDVNQMDYFTSRFGQASAGISILRRGKRHFRRVVGQSPVEPLAPYFGQRVQFPLAESIHVHRGTLVALTVPTWAPALTSLLDDGSAWRASRADDRCDRVGRQTAQTQIRQRTRYQCEYSARLTYSATLITSPKPNPPPE
jgi:hypothetical protein